jgi:bifunctional enzyme CysN/CysC
MVTGAAQADAALLLIDAQEGIAEQSRRHAHLLQLLGIRQIIVLINKMDRVDYGEKLFSAIEKDYSAYLKTLSLEALCFIPISAREGDNIVSVSKRMQWYNGPTVLQALNRCEAAKPDDALPLRFPVQDIYKQNDKRIIVGCVESGKIAVGDTLLFSPGNAKSKVATIEIWNSKTPPAQASAGQSIGITLADPVFVERGHVASHEGQPPQLTTIFRARIFWLGKQPLQHEKRYNIKLGTAEFSAELHTIEHVIDSETLAKTRAQQVQYGQVAEVIWRTRAVVALDDYAAQRPLARFVIMQDYEIAGGGTVSMQGFLDQRMARAMPVTSKNITGVELGVTREERAVGNGHFGGVLWLTGLSGSGKSTLAQKLHQYLFEKGYQVYVLDGDNIRKGLARDLGFSPEDRRENIRRVAEVAALFAEAGMIVITAFISPYELDREQARAIAPEGFHTVYVKASLEACEKRDVKGLYKKARAGAIAEFTGISAPYEEPKTPDLVIDTETRHVETCVEQLRDYVERQLVAPVEELLR